VTALLSATAIGKSFDGTRVLGNVTLSIAPGEPVGLFGPNGSGKTTLANVLTGLLPPDEGTIAFDGRDVTRLPLDARYRMGLARTFQIPHPYPSLTVQEAVRVAFAAAGSGGFPAGGSREEGIEEVMVRTGLYDQRFVPCGRLSQGCLRRLEFARATACRPKLLILDEVFSALSAADEEDLLDLLRKANRKDGAAFLLISHNRMLLGATCSRILYLEEGRIVREKAV
jgi:ABC-type branched-subunit amino acid transport system ATPase component